MTMDDDTIQDDQPSTSKNENMEEDQASDAEKNDKRQKDNFDKLGISTVHLSKMDTSSSRSDFLSVLNRVEMANTKHIVLKPATAMITSKPAEKRKKRKAVSGRVGKRIMQRRVSKKPIKRRMIKRKVTRKRYTYSSSTMGTRQSSRTSASNVGCRYCGHRCCPRRYEASREAFTGRVGKRIMQRRVSKKPIKRRMIKRKVTRKRYTYSSSTMGTRQSSRTSASNVGCRYCGHRCCRRRYEASREAFKKRREVRKLKTDAKRKVNQSKVQLNVYSESECIQAGSRSLMLSALCVNMNMIDGPPEEPLQPPQYCEVTPEMIHESVRRLTMWKQDVSTMAILDYLKSNYPVCQDIPTLFEELALKLQVAAIAGFVSQAYHGRWQLCCPFEKRQLSPNHVTLFWNTYADTMKPVQRKDLPPASVEKDDKSTSTTVKEMIKHDYDVI